MMPDRDSQLSFDGFDGAAQPATADDRSAVERPAPPQELAGRTVYVVDSHALIFQVFHAIPEMTSPHGEPVNAIYGFARDLMDLLEKQQPDYLICAFDRPGPTFRHELYEAYKADRGEMPEELAAQLPVIRRLLDVLGIPLLEYESYEADDVLATVAQQCQAVAAECFLVTTDKDCRQLISDRVRIFDLRKMQVYDKDSLAADWGIRPDQVVDFQSLVGDSVDRVPGVPRIGPKTATQLLAKFDTLDQVFEHVDEIPGAKGKYLRDGQASALLSRQLVQLMQQVPIAVDWDAARVGTFDPQAGLDLFAGLGFRGLSERLQRVSGAEVTAAPWTADYRSVTTLEELNQLAEKLAGAPQLSLDVETTSISPRWAELVGISLCAKEAEAWYVPVRAPSGETHLPLEQVLDTLRPILEDPAIEKVGQNLKYDLIVLRGAGIRVQGTAFDTMVASYLLEAGQRNHNLNDLSRRYLDHDPITITSLIGTGKQQKRMDEVPLEQIAPYAAEDADIPLRLRPILQQRIDQDALGRLFRELEIPLIDVLVELEYNGIRVDTDRLEVLSTSYGERLTALEAEIHELAGAPFNIASPKQLAKVLFEDLGLPVVKKTKTGPSTDADVLDQLAAEHPLPAKIVEYRQFAKLKNTYVDALPALVHPETGRVHASFHQVVAATGRLSSSDPNLQNIPIRTAVGREIRSAFLPDPPDWQLLAADYSQIELRVLAHCSADPVLCAAFARDEDIHAMVAGQVYGVAAGEVTPEMRRRAKAINFGVIYGQSAFGLARSLQIEQEEAAEFIDAYFQRYPRVDEFLREVIVECHQQGYVSTIFGRRRAIRGVRPDGPPRQRNLAERTAINTVIQGSAADVIKQAMITIHRRLQGESRQSRMLLQIHDELIFEVPPEEQAGMEQLVGDEMSAAADLSVPLKVDMKVGSNWAEV